MGYATGIATGEMSEQAEDVTRFVARPTERTLHLRRDNRISSLVLAAVPLSMAVALLYGSRRFREYLARSDPRGQVHGP
jgi:hypothetical protein